MAVTISVIVTVREILAVQWIVIVVLIEGRNRKMSGIIPKPH